ncbi:YunG family protein [Gynuella sp.]|uniref:YunG family protein n=1 Tax=Gynuella sp. TaxID=2969146 RepID=UPI003D0D6572
MKPSPDDVLKALQDSWSLESTEEPENWTPSNPSRGQCGISSLIINDYFGGKLVLWKVFVGEDQVGFHYSNELPDGTPFDSTGDQFWESEELKEPSAFVRPDKSPKNGAERYKALAKLVRKKLESYSFGAEITT